MAVSSLGTFYDLEVSPEKVKTKKYDHEYFMQTSATLIGSLGLLLRHGTELEMDMSLLRRIQIQHTQRIFYTC